MDPSEQEIACIWSGRDKLFRYQLSPDLPTVAFVPQASRPEFTPTGLRVDF
jgi:hypothetical protein